MENVVTKCSVCVQVNDDLGHFFQAGKGLRQGVPLSPILFNLVVDMLTVLIERAKSLGFLDGLVPHLVEDGLSILQYADDTILFIDDDLQKAKGLKIVLSAFEKFSGLKINFHKSEMFCFGETRDKSENFVHLFGCKEGEFP
jgi:retron-type reverse transcriptase